MGPPDGRSNPVTFSTVVLSTYVSSKATVGANVFTQSHGKSNNGQEALIELGWSQTDRQHGLNARVHSQIPFRKCALCFSAIAALSKFASISDLRIMGPEVSTASFSKNTNVWTSTDN